MREGSSPGDRSAAGSLFHVLGPCTAKLRWPVEVRVHGTSRAPDTADRDDRCLRDYDLVIIVLVGPNLSWTPGLPRAKSDPEDSHLSTRGYY